MKKLFLLLLIFLSVRSFGQFTKFYSNNEYLGVWGDSITNVANRDTTVAPYKIGETRFRISDSTVYIAISTSADNKWMKLRGYVPTGIGTGTVTSVASSFTNGTVLSVSGSPITGSGTLSYTWGGAGTDMVLGNGTYTDYNTLITGVTNSLYSPIGHSHVSTDVTDFTTAARASVSASGDLSYNSTTGVFSYTGLSNPMSTTGDIIYGGSSGLATRLAGNTTTTKKFLTQTGDGTNSAAPVWNTLAAGDIPNIAESQVTNLTTDLANKVDSVGVTTDSVFVYKNGVLVLSYARGLPISDTTNKWVNSLRRRSGTDTVEQLKNGTWQFAFVDSTGGAGAWGTITGTLSSQTDLQTALNTKEATFTETAEEFTGATSMSITLSNTPKSGKAEMYFLNGVVIQANNVSRVGTNVTFIGFTRKSDSIITATYSY